MSEREFLKIALSALMITACLCSGSVYSQETAAEQNVSGGETGRAKIGRENPFAGVPEEIKSDVSQQTAYAAAGVKGNKPDLFVETVLLKSLNAQSLKSAIGNMSSEHGSIAVDTKSNSLIICDTKENLKKILAQIQNAEQSAGLKPPEQTDAQKNDIAAQAETKPQLTVETVSLKFLDAKNLKAAIDGLVSPDGKISINERNNSLIICDTKENVDKILGQIRKADITPQQIMVEVVILDVQLDDNKEIGINWDILSDRNYDIAYRQNFTKVRLGSTIEDEDTIGNATAFNTTGTGGEFSIITGTIRNIVHLLQQKKDVEILASPRVMMVSGQSAAIEAVEEIPYQEITQSTGGGGGTASAITSTQFKNVGVKMKVSTLLTGENNILLNVEAEQNVETGESVAGVPIVDTRKAQSNLLLKDGQVVIFGGLRRQEKTKTVKQVPIIGDIPLLGLLFKSTNDVIKNSELVVFLSPHVYKGEAVPDDAMKKYNEISNRPLLTLPKGKAMRTDTNVGEELKTILASLEKSLSK
jgi:type II secretory pathway component GspD/PulD (secretin)